MNERSIVQKMNRSSFGSRQAQTLRRSVSVTRARSVIESAQAGPVLRNLGGGGDRPTKR